jgi:hypothetical protein
MLNLTQIYYQSNTSRTYHPSNYLKHLDLNFKITKMCFFHLKLLTTNIFFQSLLICIFEISIQFYGGTCGKCTKTSYYEEANKNNDNGGNREIKKNCLELLVSLGYSVTVGTWWRYELMVSLASGTDTWHRLDGMVGIRYRYWHRFDGQLGIRYRYWHRLNGRVGIEHQWPRVPDSKVEID